MSVLVDIYCRDMDGHPEKVMSVLGDGKKAELLFGKDHPIAASIVSEGIRGRMCKHYTIKDGESFVNELPWALSGSMVWASYVTGGEDV